MFLPSSNQNYTIAAYLISAVVLKLIQVIHMMFCQVTVDMFFIDWEQPKSSKKGKT
jgi:meckelin